MNNMDTSSDYCMASWLEGALESYGYTGWSQVWLSDGIGKDNRFFDVPENISETLRQQKRVLELKLRTVERLTFDDIGVPRAELLPSEEWVSFLTSLLYSLPSLTRITIKCSGSLYSAVCIAVGHFLSASSTLEHLEFKTCFPLSDLALRALSEGLLHTTCLTRLTVGKKSWANTAGLAPVFVNAFTGDVQNTSLECVVMMGDLNEMGRALSVLLSSSSRTLKSIDIILDWGLMVQDTVDAIQELAEGLQHPLDASRNVALNLWSHVSDYTEDVEKLIFDCLKFWREAGKCIPSQTTGLWFRQGVSMAWFRTFNEYKNLKGLQLSVQWFAADKVHLSRPAFFLLCEWIQSNDFVESLVIATDLPKRRWRSGGWKVDQEGWTHLFQCLRHKQSLKRLEVHGDLEGDECFRSLMNLLQENIYLEEVEGPGNWESEGKDALVQESLRRNKAQAAYFSILQSAGLPFEEAKVGRIFLCGEPFAGKTQLRATMIGKGRAWKLLERVGLKRTKGIDVELLRDDEKMQDLGFRRSGNIPGPSVFTSSSHYPGLCVCDSLQSYDR